jgi:predicted nucleic acid-binding protein
VISRPAKVSPANKTPAIVDTGYLVAFARREDEHHQWALTLAGRLQLPLLTCEAVLAETSFMLQSSAYVLAMLRRDVLRVALDCGSHVDELLHLAIRYADRQPDLADLCLIRMSELYPEHKIVTVDADFRIYRRNKRDVIPLICPLKS